MIFIDVILVNVKAMTFGKWDGLTSTLSTARDTGRLQLISGEK